MQLAFLRAIGLVSVALVAPARVTQAGRVQLPGLTVPSNATADCASVVQIFKKSYSAYRKYAFGHDEVTPLSREPSDPLNGWGATIIDAMSTMYIMGLTDFFNEALNFTQSINFTESNTADPVNLFESTIRYIAGLISAYELSGKQHYFLIEKAKELADRLSLAWSYGNVIPFAEVDFSSNTVVNKTSSIAGVGTLTLEWSLLSEYTGNDTYRKLAMDPVLKIMNNPMPLPGLPGRLVDPNSGLPVGGYVTWGSGSDSYFEYLIKYARLSNTDDNAFADSWLEAVDSSIKTLMKTSTIGNHVYLADYDSQGRIRHVGSHLACFHAGNWLLGGKLTNNDTIVNIGLKLNDGCWNTYAGTATGIGPEKFAYISTDGGFTGYDVRPSNDQMAFYQEHGYYITVPYYSLRPEVLESNFYAFRVTGKQVYLERARSAIASLNTYLSTEAGFAGIYDVNNHSTRQIDYTESFWFAEALKYLYLTFDDPNHISLDDYVFNTEAHPFVAPPEKGSYGSGKPPLTKTDQFVLRIWESPIYQWARRSRSRREY